MKYRPPRIDIVCHGCQTIIGREGDDGTWTIKVLVDGEIVDEWQPELWVCWNCETAGTVNAFDMIVRKTHGRVRVPTRPVM